MQQCSRSRMANSPDVHGIATVPLLCLCPTSPAELLLAAGVQTGMQVRCEIVDQPQSQPAHKHSVLCKMQG